MAKARKYTDEQFVEAVKSSRSIRQALGKLGLKEAGGNYACLQKRARTMNLDLSHWKLNRGWSKGMKLSPKRPLEDYLSNKFAIQSYELKNRLFREGYFQKQCSHCLLSQWMNEPISLELDHIDGDHTNNTLTNLRILCPNCHALTPTYRGKNKNNGGSSQTRTDTPVKA